MSERMKKVLDGENAAVIDSSSVPSLSTLCQNCIRSKDGTLNTCSENNYDSSSTGTLPNDVSGSDVCTEILTDCSNCQLNSNEMSTMNNDSGINLSCLEPNSTHRSSNVVSASQVLTEDHDTDNTPNEILKSNLSNVTLADYYTIQINSGNASIVQNEIGNGGTSDLSASVNDRRIEQLEFNDSVSEGIETSSISQIVRKKLKWLTRYIIAPAPERDVWDNSMDGAMSLIAYTVGLGNMWRFPYLCYKHGGATFLIPYCVCLLIIGLPDYFIDVSLGQYLSRGPVNVYANIAPLFSGLGWAMVTSTVLVSLYYIVVLAWTAVYIYSSFNSPLPWTHCNNSFNSKACVTEGVINKYLASEEFFTEYVIRRVNGTSLEEVSSSSYELHPTLVCSLGLSWLFVVLSLVRGIRSSGKVVYITVTFPYLILILLLTWSYYHIEADVWKDSNGNELAPLQVNSTKLLEADIWTDAASHVLFTLGQAFGGHATLASYNKIHQNTMWLSIIVVVWDTGTSFLCGTVVFTSLGALATDLKVNVGDVLDEIFEGLGVEVVFIAYPVLLGDIGLNVWAMLFFLMIFALGIDSSIGQVETITTSLFDNVKFVQLRYLPLVSVVCLLLFLMGLPFCTSMGFILVELMHTYTCTVSMLVLCFLKIFVVCYVYGFSKLMKLIREELKVPVPKFMEWYLRICLICLAPLALWTLLIRMIFFQEPHEWNGDPLPMKYRGIGWFLAISSCLIVPIVAVWVVCQNRDKHWGELLKPTPAFRPKHLRDGQSQFRLSDSDSNISICFGERHNDSSENLPPPAVGMEEEKPSEGRHNNCPQVIRRYTM